MRIRSLSRTLCWGVVVAAALVCGDPGDLRASPASGASACVIWQSNLTGSDLGQTGNGSLFASWGTIKSRTSKNLHRVSGGRAPDGSLAYQFSFSGQDNPGTRGPLIAFDQTGSGNLRHLYGEFKIYFPSGYWTSYSGGQKILRLWAGSEGQRSRTEYGRQIANDASSTFAVVHNRFRTYSYYRNRPSMNAVVNDPPRQYWQMPEGRWVTLAQEVRVNNPGTANGYLKFFIDGVEVARREGIDWLRDGNAGFQGFAFSGWVNGYRIVDQKFWMKDFKLYKLGC